MEIGDSGKQSVSCSSWWQKCEAWLQLNQESNWIFLSPSVNLFSIIYELHSHFYFISTEEGEEESFWIRNKLFEHFPIKREKTVLEIEDSSLLERRVELHVTLVRIQKKVTEGYEIFRFGRASSWESREPFSTQIQFWCRDRRGNIFEKVITEAKSQKFPL